MLIFLGINSLICTIISFCLYNFMNRFLYLYIRLAIYIDMEGFCPYVNILSRLLFAYGSACGMKTNFKLIMKCSRASVPDVL